MHTQQELDQIKEYERRLKAGLNPAPLVQRVPLEDVAGYENVERVTEIEKLRFTSTSTIRGITLKFVTSSKRLLWQAHGQEHIEPELLDFIDLIPNGDMYFDIGSSVGIFALYAAARSMKVVCFEPEVANFALLNQNTYLNHQIVKSQILNFNVALSNESGMGSINIEKFEPGGHLKILDSNLKRGKTNFIPDFSQPVLKYSLDDFLAFTKISPPNFIKIDVDGAEFQVLSGMTRTLMSQSLKKVFIELEEGGERFRACDRILGDNGFKIESRKRVQNYFGEENIVYTR